MKLKPSAKMKRRYLLIRGGKKDIENAILDYIGILGWANSSPYFVGQKGKEWILAVNRKELDRVKASFAVYPEKIEVIKVSGTLRGIK
ncbi:hypothetical protein GW924_04400 [Candidatus Pacearchaeota archaeon]|nr:hypothetical protein [Candidatus Pacearchaeota archaeon]OIO43613.1 MAG: hypothetical protein AUJ64_02045 [Candidatus Pacearchaeota archaeon CG1_02_39_14]